MICCVTIGVWSLNVKFLPCWMSNMHWMYGCIKKCFNKSFRAATGFLPRSQQTAMLSLMYIDIWERCILKGSCNELKRSQGNSSWMLWILSHNAFNNYHLQQLRLVMFCHWFRVWVYSTTPPISAALWRFFDKPLKCMCVCVWPS